MIAFEGLQVESEKKTDGCIVNDLDLSLFVPRYKVMKKGFELGGNSYVVHLRRKYIKLPLFVRSFYLACYSMIRSKAVHPESSFTRMFVDKNYYSRKNGRMVKNTRSDAKTRPYLSWNKKVDRYNGQVSTYYSVVCRLTDPSTDELNLGFSMESFSINTRLFITKELREKIGNVDAFDFASFFYWFLRDIGYHKAVYVTSYKYHVLHRLYALQKEMKGIITEGDFY